MGAPEATCTMSRDHLAINRLGGELAELRRALQAGPPNATQLNALRRVLYGLYAVVKLHFAKEEELYLPLLEAQLNEEEMRDLLRAMSSAAAQVGRAAAGLGAP
jgi:hypothetical protein